MHPYSKLPAQNFWRKAVEDKVYSEINFKPSTKFTISQGAKISTGGSCFAQHIAANLTKFGLNHFVTEEAPAVLSSKRAAELHYGQFSARYGNIYTARQLRQLIEFAFNVRHMIVLTEESDRGWIDLLRPGVDSEGFGSLHDLECDRLFHLACVKRMFLESDFFVFTLGLTEAWYDTFSDLVFPICPGTKAGKFNPSRHHFVNFNVIEVIEDLRWCVEFIKAHNPNLRWIFTVSPVALSATATPQNVLVATAASKSILRAATEEVINCYDNCEYFPSLEITTSPPSFGQFLSSDLREISPRGVSLVLGIFKRAFASATEGENAIQISSGETQVSKLIDLAIRTECEEEFNDPESLV
jgi:hypothetical protein